MPSYLLHPHARLKAMKRKLCCKYLYKFLYTFTSSVTHVPFVRKMPAFCTTLYLVIFAQIALFAMFLTAQICAKQGESPDQ